MKNLRNGLFGFSPDGDDNSIQDIYDQVKKEVEENYKKSKEAFKNYKKPAPKPINITDGTTIYALYGCAQMQGSSFQDFLDDINGVSTPPPQPDPNDGQHYILIKATAKSFTNKKGQTYLKLSKETKLFDQVGKNAWGPVYPGGPIETNVLFGFGHVYDGNSFNDIWFTDYNTAKARFDYIVKNGYEHKF